MAVPRYVWFDAFSNHLDDGMTCHTHHKCMNVPLYVYNDVSPDEFW